MNLLGVLALVPERGAAALRGDVFGTGRFAGHRAQGVVNERHDLIVLQVAGGRYDHGLGTVAPRM
jgi:hypothetical protein